jgi:plasmid stabilization system protein ParE
MYAKNMAYNILLSPKATLDIEAAFEYYCEKSLQTLKNLDKELNTAYEAISINPHYKIRYKNVTGFPLKKFPYLFIIYNRRVRKNYIHLQRFQHVFKS